MSLLRKQICLWILKILEFKRREMGGKIVEDPSGKRVSYVADPSSFLMRRRAYSFLRI